MPLILTELGTIDIPEWVRDLPTFLAWTESDDYPEKTRAHFINGRVWVESTMERALSHNRVKTALTLALEPLTQPIGVLFGDGMKLVHEPTGLGTVPDGMVVTRETLQAGRAVLADAGGATLDGTRLVGTPDLVIEVVSASSEDKDTEWLMAAYHNAGVPEYWLIDARRPPPRLDILHHRKKGYVAARKRDGWSKSEVYGKAFRLDLQQGELVYPTFKLDIR